MSTRKIAVLAYDSYAVRKMSRFSCRLRLCRLSAVDYLINFGSGFVEWITIYGYSLNPREQIGPYYYY